MREKLSRQEGERKKFTATFSRFGKKINFKGFSEETILLVDVRDAETGEVVTRHLWFTYSKVFQGISLREGTIIGFDARVRQYKKGYVNRRAGINQSSNDFRLSHPTRVTLLH